MSYDLFFIAERPWTAGDFAEHFGARAGYEVRERQAWYANEDTGTYFSFELPAPEDAEEDEELEHWASFNLNFFRPRSFAEEAAIELDAFTARFGKRVHDPQTEGIGDDGEYSAEAFRRGWDHGNAFACRALLASDASVPAPTVKPAAELHRIWQWNYSRHRRQEQVGDDIFVPRISFYRTGGEVLSASVWGDGIPIMLPQTDMVIVYRDELAPRRWFRRKEGATIVRWEAVLPHIRDFDLESAPLPHYRIDAATPPTAIAEWIRSLPDPPEVEGISIDDILDADLVNPSRAEDER